MASVAFHPEAQAEYEDALAWYQARSVRSAARFEVEVDRVLKLIAALPDSYPRYDDDHRFAILKRFPFSLVYQPQPGRVFIVAVAHSSRSAGYWRGRTGGP